MYAWRKSLGFTLCIILAFTAAVASSSAIPAVENEVPTNPPQPITADPSTKDIISTSPLLLPRAPSMQRIPPGTRVSVSHGWVITVRALTSLLFPIQPTSSALELVFRQALLQLSKSLLQNRPPPGNAIDITVGAVRLALRAVNPVNFLTWETCEIVVAKLLGDAERGFTGQFRSEWYHHTSRTLLYVNVEVVQGGTS